MSVTLSWSITSAQDPTLQKVRYVALESCALMLSQRWRVCGGHSSGCLFPPQQTLCFSIGFMIAVLKNVTVFPLTKPYVYLYLVLQMSTKCKHLKADCFSWTV